MGQADQCSFSIVRCASGGLSAWAEEAWASSDALIFIGSCGIAVRAISPFVKKKTEDPAVVVIDELGTYSIPVLSGHLGGANELAVKLARLLGAIPVVTTATDINGLFAADDWARSQGLAVANPGKIKFVSSRVLAGEKLKVKSLYDIAGQIPSCLEYAETGYDILISHRSRGSEQALRLVPKVVTLGVGCHRNIELSALETAFDAVLSKSGCHRLAVFQAASLDLKKDEPALIEFCEKTRFSVQDLHGSRAFGSAGRVYRLGIRKEDNRSRQCLRKGRCAGLGRQAHQQERSRKRRYDGACHRRAVLKLGRSSKWVNALWSG